MNTLLLLIVIISIPVQAACKKDYNQKASHLGVFLFSGLTALFSASFFVIASGGKLHFDPELIPWSAAFGVTYAMPTVFSLLALSYGSMALTSLVTSYSLVLPTVYGILFLGDPISPFLFIGIAMLLVSLFLINFKPGSGTKISLRWAIFAFLAFVGNGICTIVQKVQQLHFEGAYKSEFMILALLLVFPSMLLLTLFKERKTMGPCLRLGWKPALIGGLTNGLANMTTMVLNGRIPASVLFPLMSAGGILATTFVSMIFFHEKLSRNQIIGILLGIGAIIFLSI